MGYASALVFGGALLGYLPLRTQYARSGAEGLANSFLIGLGIRLFFTLAGVLVLGMGLVPGRAAFLLWAGILYAVMLVVEILQLVRGLSSGGQGGRVDALLATRSNVVTSQDSVSDVRPPTQPMPLLTPPASARPVTPPKGSATA